MIAFVTWRTNDPHASDDEVVNDIREAIARAGYQVGDCVTSRSHMVGEAHVEVSGASREFIRILDFKWQNMTVEVESVEDSSPFIEQD